MADQDRRSQLGLFGNFRRLFMRGLAALLPTLVTIAILIWVYEFVDTHIGRYLTRGFALFLAQAEIPSNGDLGDFIIAEAKKDALTYGDPTGEITGEGDLGGFLDDAKADALTYGDPTGEVSDEGDAGEDGGRYLTRQYKAIEYWENREETSEPALRRLVIEVTAARYRSGRTGFALSFLGFLVAIMLVWVTGLFLASFLGRRTWPRIEAFVTQLPVVKAIYPHVKQVTDFLFSEGRKTDWSQVVAVQYPRRGIWSVGLLTGTGMDEIRDAAGVETVSIFIPSSPTPFTGYVITVPRSEIVNLPLSIDDALRFTISGGVIKPLARSDGAAAAAGSDPATRPASPPPSSQEALSYRSE